MYFQAATSQGLAPGRVSLVNVRTHAKLSRITFEKVLLIFMLIYRHQCNVEPVDLYPYPFKILIALPVHFSPVDFFPCCLVSTVWWWFDNLISRIAFFWWPEPSSTKAASCGDKNMMTTVMTMTTMMIVVVVMIAIDWPLWLVIGHDNHEDDDDGGGDYGWGQWRKCLRLLSRLSLVLPPD